MLLSYVSGLNESIDKKVYKKVRKAYQEGDTVHRNKEQGRRTTFVYVLISQGLLGPRVSPEDEEKPVKLTLCLGLQQTSTNSKLVSRKVTSEGWNKDGVPETGREERTGKGKTWTVRTKMNRTK